MTWMPNSGQRNHGKEIEQAITKILKDYAIDSPENQALHGWRCKYPDRYPEPCGHFEELVADLVKFVLQQEKDAYYNG